MRGDGGNKRRRESKGEGGNSFKQDGKKEGKETERMGQGGEKVSSSSKVYGYSSSQSNLSHRYGNSHAIWDHTVLGLPATRQK